MTQPEVRAALDRLPQYYTYREVLEALGGSRDHFIEAYVRDYFPPPVRALIDETMAPTTLQSWMLARLLRLWLEDTP